MNYPVSSLSPPLKVENFFKKPESRKFPTISLLFHFLFLVSSSRTVYLAFIPLFIGFELCIFIIVCLDSSLFTY